MGQFVSRTNVINFFADKFSYESYLEIGVAKKHNFNKIRCNYKVGIDPDPKSNGQKIDSDNFFLRNSETFDLIFIDGLHHSDQLEKDIINSLEVLNKNGTIICHDINPKTKEEQIVPRIQGSWTGDCWKAWVKFRQSRADLNMFTINANTGCGVIRKGHQKLLDLDGHELNYENLKNNRKEWLNLIEFDEVEQYL